MTHQTDSWLTQAMSLHQAGELHQAGALYQKILSIEPKHVDALHLLGLTHHQSGQHALAAQLIGKAISIAPAAPMYCNQGVVLQALQQWQEAEKHFRKALALAPQYADAFNNLGNLMLAQGDAHKAIDFFLKAIEINPRHDALNNLGNAYKDIGNLDEAIRYYKAQLAINPLHVDAINNLGVSLHAMGKLDEAIECYQKSLAISPANSGACNNMGNAYLAKSNLEEAGNCYRQAIAINPENVEAHNNLGLVLQAKGELENAISSFRRALEVKPDYAGAHNGLIFIMDMQPSMSIEALQNERKDWSRRHAEKFFPPTQPITDPLPHKKLRVGYISGDFRKHSASHVFCHMLTDFDRSNFETYAYSNSNFEDYRTELIKKNCTAWRNITGISDQTAAELIKEDRIDILVDLSGFTEGNRLLIFAKKPAPIQITAWGYIGGTGMKVMDVFFADEIIIPPEEQHLYAEKIVYLPSVVCYYPFEPFPAVNTLPALAGRGVTFGSFNRLIKVTEETFDVWARVLHAIPNSRMVLKTPELDDAGSRNRVLGLFAQAGIAPERITLLGGSSWMEHMAAFNQVDLALDPFPHGGGVTTLEGVMMGIPTVTLRWPTVPGRLSAALLTPIGLTDWIAESAEQYVSIAVEKASNPMALAILRKQLRSRMLLSPVGNPQAYAKEVEKVYRQLWQEWCATA